MGETHTGECSSRMGLLIKIQKGELDSKILQVAQCDRARMAIRRARQRGRSRKVEQVVEKR